VIFLIDKDIRMSDSKPKLLARSGIRGLYYFKGKYYCWGVETCSYNIYLDLNEFRVRIPELENFNYFQTATIQKKLFPKSILAIVGKHTVNYQKILNAYLAEEYNRIISFANDRQLLPRYVFEIQTEDKPQTTNAVEPGLDTGAYLSNHDLYGFNNRHVIIPSPKIFGCITKAQIAEEKAAKLAKQATRNQRRK
jgi:hypothetical protein